LPLHKSGDTQTIDLAQQETQISVGHVVRKKRMVQILGAGLVVATLVGVSAWRATHPPVTPAVTPATASVARRRTLAVFPLENNARQAEAAWLSTAIAEMMTTELGAGE